MHSLRTSYMTLTMLLDVRRLDTSDGDHNLHYCSSIDVVDLNYKRHFAIVLTLHVDYIRNTASLCLVLSSTSFVQRVHRGKVVRGCGAAHRLSSSTRQSTTWLLQPLCIFLISYPLECRSRSILAAPSASTVGRNLLPEVYWLIRATQDR